MRTLLEIISGQLKKTGLQLVLVYIGLDAWCGGTAVMMPLANCRLTQRQIFRHHLLHLRLHHHYRFHPRCCSPQRCYRAGRFLQVATVAAAPALLRPLGRAALRLARLQRAADWPRAAPVPLLQRLRLAAQLALVRPVSSPLLVPSWPHHRPFHSRIRSWPPALHSYHRLDTPPSTYVSRNRGPPVSESPPFLKQ